MGNLGVFEKVECTYANLDETKSSKMEFQCPGTGFQITEVKKFGLAFKDKTCVGQGMSTDVQTIDYCSPIDKI